MNTKIQLFENPEFGLVRTMIEENGKVLFCGKDIATALGYIHTADAIAAHCKGVCVLPTPTRGGIQNLKYVTEGDVYRLIVSSQLPASQKFEHWLFDEVVPTIRKTGAYITPQMLEQLAANPGSAALLFQELKQIQTQIADMEPKAAYYNALVEAKLLTNTRDTAKELKFPPKLFAYLLVEMKLAYRNKKNVLLPSAFMVNNGYAEIKEYTNNNHCDIYMLFTPKGRLYLTQKIEKRLAVKMVVQPKCLQ